MVGKTRRTVVGYGRASISSGATGHRADTYHLWRRDREQVQPSEPPQEKPQDKKRKQQQEKKTGKKRLAAPVWLDLQSLTVRAMTLTPDKLLVAGPPDLGRKTADLLAFDNPDEALAGFLGQRGVYLRLVSTKDGATLAEYPLGAMPVFDGMSAAEGNVVLALQDGTVVCWGKK